MTLRLRIRMIPVIGMLLAVGPAFVTSLYAQTEGSSTQTEASSVRIMSYNIYRGGTQRGQPLSQTVKVIQEAKADIVGIQETRSSSGVNTKKLAELLGWNYYVNPRNKVILTRYEIVEEKRDGVKVKLPAGQEAYIFNLHLASNPYQPYQLLSIQPKWHKHKDTPFIKTEAEAIAGARKARGKEISALLSQIRNLPDKETPVFVVGDFNEPSHLDWTAAAADSGRHPIKVAYPNSLEMAKAGFADAWRTIHPDEMKKPGFTWSPMYKPDDPTTHHDRIDFVYFKGKSVKVNDAKVIGESKENADIIVSPYPSDHRALVTTFTVSNQTKSGKLTALEAKEMSYKSSADESKQPAMFYAPASETSVPLIVALHTWSGNYKQKSHKVIEQWCIKQGWAYIPPDFRGPNNRPEATGSKLVVADIASAVEYAKKTTNIDNSAIYLVGTSGGGYTSLVMAGHHPEIWAGVSAWVPISDLSAWHAQGKHVDALVASCGGAPGDNPAVDAEYASRSPITYLKKAKRTPLQISAGIRDKIVPISHSLFAFNEVVAVKDRLSDEDIHFFIEKRKVPPKLQPKLSDPTYGKNQPLFQRASGNATVTIFDGGHELVATAAIAWIQQVHNEKKKRNKPNISAAADQGSATKFRVVAYNVACGQWATPEQIAEMFKPLNPDVVLLNEAPKANPGKKVKDWSLRVAEALDLNYVHVGTVSSANHKAPQWGDVTGDYGGKFKSILSRTPLSEGRDILVEGSGWKRASAVRVETEIGGRKFAIYSLHLPGFAHHKKQPTSPDAWKGSKHKALSDHINAEDASYDIIVGGDFNEWTDGLVMKSLSKTTKLKNVITERSIDHILYSTATPIKVLTAKRDWGPKNQNTKNEKADGCLSDHPWVWCELEISARTSSK
ncbi:MAG: prolyl oligopeptidase family serine peptidase [Planctomycetaceae bacterium]|nr:prolyl oligopeptidase family serine peptidase [Planctomycetaceae bacterium]